MSSPHERAPDEKVRPYAQTQRSGNGFEVTSGAAAHRDDAGKKARKGWLFPSPVQASPSNVFSMKNNLRKRRKQQSKVSQPVSHRRELERRLKQILAEQISLESAAGIKDSSSRSPIERSLSDVDMPRSRQRISYECACLGYALCDGNWAASEFPITVGPNMWS
jgi:hypothetical protein